ncbi:cytochrome C [Hahella sp. CCB-MM4]|uniref:c-type cytochrome n=1 Tax=Hahella sp. (strain CCB-MM4) TaxID=1926491 RepID=UPI000B9BEE7E|nr:cytochrome c [Hahella sp. CCB-MM4]OZG72970.1 cytochrome C [Hahella sp. CCB-MM4]
MNAIKITANAIKITANAIKITVVIPILLLSLLSTTSFAADPAAGKTKSATCAGCHGAVGISGNDLWPNLAGQKKGYLAKQLKAFRDGTRSDPMMSSMAKPLSDADIDDLSAYYSELK